MKEKLTNVLGYLLITVSLSIALPSIIVGFYVSTYQAAKNFFDVAIRTTGK